MRLSDGVAEYVAYKRALGMCFDSEARILASFCRYLGDVPIASVTADCVQAYLDGKMPVSSYWQRKHTALAGLFRFAMARGYAATSPLPLSRPRLPPPLVPVHLFAGGTEALTGGNASSVRPACSPRSLCHAQLDPVVIWSMSSPG